MTGLGDHYSLRYDVNASLPVLLDDGTRKYVWGLGLAYAVDALGSVFVYHADGLGSVRALTDASGTIVQTYQYDEYGNVTSSQGSVNQPFQYTGEQRDETGFTYLRARYYDSASGRLVSRDPFGGLATGPTSLNRYAYVEANPVNNVDPSGRCVDPGGPGLRYCIDRYIPSASAWGFVGDNRGPDASGGSYRIRQLIWQNDDGSLASSVLPGITETAFPDPRTGKPASGPGRLDGCSVQKSKVLGGAEITATCGGRQGLLPIAPSIITSVTISETATGASASARGTLYPSLEVWQYGGPNGPVPLVDYDANRYPPGALIWGERGLSHNPEHLLPW